MMDPRPVAIIDELTAIVRAHPQDLDWQRHYDNEQELVSDLRDHAERMDAYVRLANRFDELYTGPSTLPRRPSP
jgi:hypothetical protein